MSRAIHTLEAVRPLLESAGARIVGDAAEVRFDKVAGILGADDRSLVFISSTRRDKQSLAQATQACLIICDPEVRIEPEWLAAGKCFIVTEAPKRLFIKIFSTLFGVGLEPTPAGIHPTAVIHPGARLGRNLRIGPHVTIGESEIGDGTVIHGNCFIYDNVTIGSEVTIKAGAVIGGTGFGYEVMEDGQCVNFPHLGRVIIEDFVEIGSNTCIDRGGLTNTVIKQGAKIDNLVHIAHNVTIGERCLIVANSVVCGSSSLGKATYLGPSVTIQDGLEVGQGATVGSSSYVNRSIPAGETWIGVPAMALAAFAKLQFQLRRLIQPRTLAASDDGGKTSGGAGEAGL